MLGWDNTACSTGKELKYLAVSHTKHQERKVEHKTYQLYYNKMNCQGLKCIYSAEIISFPREIQIQSLYFHFYLANTTQKP